METADTAPVSALERSWWFGAPAVLVAPRAVFASLRDESPGGGRGEAGSLPHRRQRLGPGDRIFGGFLCAAAGWSVVLLLVGVRAVHGWSWPRSFATTALAAALPALIVAATLS